MIEPIACNPINTVNGYHVPCPSSYQWNAEDISKSDAGRTEDGKMHKNLLRQVIGIDLVWNNLTTDEASTVLRAFESEYVEVNYLDPKDAGYVTREFYVGNRSAPLYNAKLNVWTNVAFRIIER